jgi:hypothetical protein
MTIRVLLVAGFLVLASTLAPERVTASDTLYFTAIQDARQPILNLIAAEKERIDIGVWWFNDKVVSDALLRRFEAGVQVRFLADVLAYNADANTKAQIDYLASHGIPIRFRSMPANSNEILHWKCGIFAGQNKVAFGSANWTVYSLRPYSSTNYDDDTVLVTDDTQLVPAFKMRFDRMWVDTTAFTDFANVTAAVRVRREPDALLPPSMIWSQGTPYNTRLIAEIDAEQQTIDFVLYRLVSASVADALVRRAQAGVRVRLVIDPVQYRNGKLPGASANIDKLWAASVTIVQRVHQGITHMKTIVTSTIATNGSSNVTDGVQRDHNYFIERALEPTLYDQLKARLAAMLADTRGFAPFRPQPPGSATLLAPANGATGVSLTPVLDWSDAAWATNYDVMLGTSASAMRVVAARAPGSKVTLSSLQPATTYYWSVKARTNATPRDGSLSTTTGTWSFRTGVSGTNVAPVVSLTAPANGATFAAPANISLSASASDGDGTVARVEFMANSTRVCVVTTQPYGCTWSVSEAGSYTVTAVATDNSGARVTSTARSITVTGSRDTVVLWAAGVPSTQVHGDWRAVADASAAGQIRLANPDRGAPKLLTASASPVSYFDVTFTASAGKPYHLWLRLRAENDRYTNDSVFVQFSGSVTGSGTAINRIGTTEAAVVSLEDTNGAGVLGWGWNDNGWASLGPSVYFAQSGTQRMRVQVREDGVSIDQIVLSPSTYLTSSPGALKNDRTILPR